MLKINNVPLSLGTIAMFTGAGVSVVDDKATESASHLALRFPYQPQWNNRKLESTRHFYNPKVRDYDSQEAGVVATCLNMSKALSVSTHQLVLCPYQVMVPEQDNFHCDDIYQGKFKAPDLGSGNDGVLLYPITESDASPYTPCRIEYAQPIGKEEVYAFFQSLFGFKFEDILNIDDAFEKFKEHAQVSILYFHLLVHFNKVFNGLGTHTDQWTLYNRLHGELKKKFPFLDEISAPETSYDLAYRNFVYLKGISPVRLAVLDGNCRVTAALSAMFFCDPEFKATDILSRSYSLSLASRIYSDWTELGTTITSNEMLLPFDNDSYLSHDVSPEGSVVINKSVNSKLFGYSTTAQKRNSTIDSSSIFEAVKAFHTSPVYSPKFKVFTEFDPEVTNRKYTITDIKNLCWVATVFLKESRHASTIEFRRSFQDTLRTEGELIDLIKTDMAGYYISTLRKSRELVTVLDMMTTILLSPTSNSRGMFIKAAKDTFHKLVTNFNNSPKQSGDVLFLYPNSENIPEVFGPDIENYNQEFSIEDWEAIKNKHQQNYVVSTLFVPEFIV